MSNHTIVSVVIGGVTYPYVQNDKPFETSICYDDGGTIKKIALSKIDSLVTA